MLKHYHTVSIIFLFLFSIPEIQAQRYLQEAEFFSVQNGLSQAQVNCILQDSYGFLWIGTQDGLNRYDGIQFAHYHYIPYEQGSLSNNYIRCIVEDQDGNLWIGTDNGLNKFIRKTGKFESFTVRKDQKGGLGSNQIYALYCGKDNSIWIKTSDALERLNPATGKFQRFQHYKNPLNFVAALQHYSIVEDKDGQLWMGTKDGLNRFDIHSNRFDRFSSTGSSTDLTHDFVRALFYDKNHQLWIGTANGLNCYNPIEKTFSSWYPDGNKEGQAFNSINAIAEDSKGFLWLGTDAGLSIFNPVTKEFSNYGEILTATRTYTFTSITSVYLDLSGIMWLGDLNGLYKLDTKTRKFQLYRRTLEGSPGFSSNTIASVWVDDSDKIWLGTWGNGLNVFQRSKNIVEYYTSESPNPLKRISNDFVHVIYSLQDGSVILGTRNGADILLPGAKKFISFCNLVSSYSCNVFRNNRIYRILEDSRNNIWFGTAFGLHRFHKDSKQLTSYYQIEQKNTRLDINTVYSLLEDPSGRIWFGTDNGLNRFDVVSGNFTHFERSSQVTDSSISSNSVYTLFLDSRGDIWIGTESGLNKFIPENDKFIYFTTRDGLPNSFIYSIEEDTRGHLWISTNRGIVKFDTGKRTFQSFDLSDGLQNYEYNIGCSYRTKWGELFFGGIEGLNSFRPDSVEINARVPKIHITDVELIGNTKTTMVLSGAQEQLIIPKDVKLLNISFASLDFTYPSRNNFAYMISREGQDGEWIDINNRHTATFAKLRPGTYIFRVKGSNSDHIWNEEGESLKLIVQAPFWQTRLAISLYVIFGIIIIGGGIYFRIHSLSESNRILSEKQAAAWQISKQRELLLQKNKNITDSLNYAKRIQEALMPSERHFRKILPESFIFHRPKDIVSGDFYWIYEKNGIIAVAAIDCTGHGVPGAFVSLIGYELFRKVAQQTDLKNPALFLNMLNTEFADVFKGVEGFSLKDGMDISFCSLDTITRKLVFAGAINPVYLIRDDKVEELKGDRFSIGLDTLGEQVFTNHEVQLTDEDMLYVFSDGFVDQFGGTDEKKFKYRRFRILLLNIHKLSMEEQKEKLEESFNNWKGDYDQIDDVLVIGFRPLGGINPR